MSEKTVYLLAVTLKPELKMNTQRNYINLKCLQQ